MYLFAKKYIANYNKKEEVKKAEKVRKLFPEMFKSGNLDSVEIVFEVGYWRKANHIHRWFVENCQNGIDNCGYYFVSREDLIRLKNICEKVIKDIKKAKELLPTYSGFFFGSMDYDEDYLKDVEDTIEIINKCLKLPEEWNFEYTSSW